MLNESEILLRDKVEFQFRHDQDKPIQYPYQHSLNSLKETRILFVKISSQEIKQPKLGKKWMLDKLIVHKPNKIENKFHNSSNKEIKMREDQSAWAQIL